MCIFAFNNKPKRHCNDMRRTNLLTALFLLLSLQLWAVNEKVTVEQVTETINLTTDVDYIVTSPTPFASSGIVNIENTDHAVLILSGVKPSKALSLLASRVQIAGEKAVNNQNCQVKLYNRGCIILPYGNSVKPLTVYSEQNFEGDQCNDFGLESDGGFMNTLSTEKLNNRIRSFRLKRGYMVTFSLRAGGRGYSRCFIAADQDLEMATMPAILDRSISSYRIFKWYDTGKPQLAAAGGDTGACSALNVTSTYTWGVGSNMAPDVENVPHHIYEGYPGISDLGKATWSPHMKNNNEPRNSADDHPQTLAEILGNWEELMRTGMRLCSPSSWDGSDYWNGTGFLKQFFDSIDARGWRCDILDMHCYWPEGNFGNLQNWVNAVHRPIWISEWCWGASWNHDGAFANGVTQTQVRDALKRICTKLNSYNYVERYFYWNSEADISKLYKGGSLTPAGTMYSQLDGGVGYNGKYDYVPKCPKQQDPKDLAVVFNRETGKADLLWYDYNHEMNEYIHAECRKGNNQSWEVVRDVTGIETEGQQILSGVEAQMGWEFRIVEKDANGKTRQTKTVKCLSSDMRAGDAIEVNGETKYLGGNIIVNGQFDMGMSGWKNGQGEPLSHPWFQVITEGNMLGGPCLQCYGNGTANTESAVRTVFPIEPGKDYYFQADAADITTTGSSLKLSDDGVTNKKTIVQLNNTQANWASKVATFNSGEYGYAIVTLYSLGSKGRVANFILSPLFDTLEEALADGAARERQKAEALADYYPRFKSYLAEQLGKTDADLQKDYNNVKNLINNTLRAQKALPRLTAICQDAQTLSGMYCLNGYEQLKEASTEMGLKLQEEVNITPEWVLENLDWLSRMMADFLVLEPLEGLVTNPTFNNTNGWQTKTGTYKEGTQQVNRQGSVPYWSAYWSLPKEGNEEQTMGISQTVKGLAHGLYALECKAATEHYCITDQHAFITNGADTLNSSVLSADYLDLPLDGWQTLTTAPVYIEQGGSLTIGFIGSKQNAIDLAWREVGNPKSEGDHREGSWAATEFKLHYRPLYKVNTAPGQWGVVCLPYAVTPSPHVKFYQIAAITEDSKKLCLEEITETEPGIAFIYKADEANACLLEYGEAVTTTTDAPGNLRGFLTSSARVPYGYYILTDGVWQKLQEGAERPRIGNNNAIMRPLNDKNSKPIPVVSSWAGETMPIEGVTEEEIAAGITLPQGTMEGSEYYYFTLGGQRIEGGQPRPGIYLKVGNGIITKTIIK